LRERLRSCSFAIIPWKFPRLFPRLEIPACSIKSGSPDFQSITLHVFTLTGHLSRNASDWISPTIASLARHRARVSIENVSLVVGAISFVRIYTDRFRFLKSRFARMSSRELYRPVQVASLYARPSFPRGKAELTPATLCNYR